MENNKFVKRTCCPGCHSESFNIFFSCSYMDEPIKTVIQKRYPARFPEHYFLNTAYSLASCLNCSLIFQTEIPSDVFLDELYQETFNLDTYAGKYYHYSLQHYIAIANEILMVIEHFNKLPEKLNFYDFGMGWGKWCKMVLAFGCNVHGTEFSELRIDYAKKNGIQNIPMENLKNFKYDFINTDMVFEHLQKPLETLRILRESLNPNGLIKISVPNGSNIREKMKKTDWNANTTSDKSLDEIAPLEHLNCFNRKALLKMADNAGLKEFIFPFRFHFTYIQIPRLKNFIFNLLKPIYRLLYWNSSWGNSCIFFELKKNG